MPEVCCGTTSISTNNSNGPNRLGETLSTDTEDHRSLRHVSIFADLQPDTLARLDACCQWRQLPAESNVISLQDTATDIYFLTQGLARVVIPTARGKDIGFRTIFPGDIFGEFAAIDDGPRSATVTLVEPSVIGSMTAGDFRNAMANEPEVGLAVLRHLTNEMRQLTGRVLEFSTLAVSNRIQAELVRLARTGVADTRGVVIHPAPRHSLLAGRVSTHREAVTKEFGRLTRLGVIERSGGCLVIKDIGRLQSMVRDAIGGG